MIENWYIQIISIPQLKNKNINIEITATLLNDLTKLRPDNPEDNVPSSL